MVRGVRIDEKWMNTLPQSAMKVKEGIDYRRLKKVVTGGLLNIKRAPLSGQTYGIQTTYLSFNKNFRIFPIR